ncbi:MAG: hypothetical protein HC837_11950 [Chloroflexaceae bacterium]|nr:hypothetical protein [Chloroflexaceae bacterium]
MWWFRPVPVATSRAYGLAGIPDGHSAVGRMRGSKPRLRSALSAAWRSSMA